VRALAALLTLAAVANTAQAWSPETNYRLHCEGCHLADGVATPDKVPALAGSVAAFLRAPEGRAYLVRVPGVASASLSDAELAALLDWTLRRFDAANLPADFAPYTAGEVRRWRAQPLVDVAVERAKLLEAIQAAR
jgi:cytochrome c553